MKAPKEVNFSFNPDISLIPALHNRIGKILWSCIKATHIVDQNFNDDVIYVVEKISIRQPKQYRSFLKIIRYSKLNVFGTKWIDNVGLPMSGRLILDDEFWQDVWKYIKGKKELIYLISQ